MEVFFLQKFVSYKIDASLKIIFKIIASVTF